MAYIGLYGVYYSKATMSNGQVASYTGKSTMGSAISAGFEPNSASENKLYANNSVAEVDASNPAGGKLTLTVDKLSADSIADIFGMTKNTKTVTVGTTTVQGTGFDYSTNDTANTIGVAFIREKQEGGTRTHEAVIYAAVTFAMPKDSAKTIGESIEWQTPELEGAVTTNSGSYPWAQKYTFPTKEACEAFITNYFAAPSP